MPKYVKAADQLVEVVDKVGNRSTVTDRAYNVIYKARGYQLASDVIEPESDYSKLSTDDLQGITNNDLKAYLDEKEIEYASNATKKDLIELVAGK